MVHKAKYAVLPLLLAAGALLAAALPLEALTAFGGWLRSLSLSGGGGNVLAWALVLVLTALPALGLLWRGGGRRWDWLLLLAAAEIFTGLYFLVNPSLLHPVLDASAAGKLWALAAAGSVAAALLAWAVLRGLGQLEGAAHPGRTLEALLGWSAVLIGALAAWSRGAAVLEKLRAVAEANTAPGAELWPTRLSLCLLGAADLIPVLLGCAVLLWSGKLARALEEEPFGAETVALAKQLSRRCGRVAAASVLVCAAGNLGQMLLFGLLHDMHFQVSFPVTTVLLAVSLDLLCRYLRRAKAVSDDNESII